MNMKCEKCSSELEYTDGWIPSYYNPDNHNLDVAAEPFCLVCDRGSVLDTKESL